MSLYGGPKVDIRDKGYLECLQAGIEQYPHIKAAALTGLEDENGSLRTCEKANALADTCSVIFNASPPNLTSISDHLSEKINEFIIHINDDYLLGFGVPSTESYFFVFQKGDNSGFSGSLAVLEQMVSGFPPTEGILRGLTIEGEILTDHGGFLDLLIPNIFSSETEVANVAKNLFGSSKCGSAIEALQRFSTDGHLLKGVQFAGNENRYGFLRVAFAPAYILALSCKSTYSPIDLNGYMKDISNSILRKIIGAQLSDPQFSADTAVAKDSAEFDELIDQLRHLDPDDLMGRLVIGGFANHSIYPDEDNPDFELKCEECIYYLRNQKWCDLPELPLPVEPHWYCRLWKI